MFIYWELISTRQTNRENTEIHIYNLLFLVYSIVYVCVPEHMCLSYFSNCYNKNHNHGNLQKKGIVGGLLKVWRVRTWPSWQRAWRQKGRYGAGAVAEGSHLEVTTMRQRKREKERVGEWGERTRKVWTFETSKPIPVTHLLQQIFTSKSFPKSSTNWRPHPHT